MLIRYLLVAVTFMLFGSVALAQENEPAPQAEILKELRALRREVKELTKRVEALEAALAQEQEPEPLAARLPSGESRERGPDIQALRKIKLPENPTKEEVREYVHRIVAVSAHQNHASSTDPQVWMLRKVGPENVDILLDQLRYVRWSLADTYLTQAVKDLAKKQHKEEILEYLPVEPELVSVVLQYGWAADAREVLLSELEVPGTYIPQEWLQAVASLGDAEALAALKTYFVEGRNRDTTFEVLRMTPGIENLGGLVAKAWKRATAQGGDEALDTAEVAVGYGHEDALALLMRFLATGQDPRGSAPFVRRTLLLHTEARGTSEQIVHWYQENKDRLHWDSEARKFRVSPEERPPAPAAPGGTQ